MIIPLKYFALASGYIAQALWSILSNIPMPRPLYYHMSRASKFSFLSTNNISYEIWYVQLKFETHWGCWGQNLGLWRLLKWPRSRRENNASHFLKSSTFEVQKRNVPQKKAENNRHWYLKQNHRLLFWKNWKKINSTFFDLKKL